jgi:acyl carrier protein
LTPPERRAALLRHVREELAGVLGLSVERRDELDPGLRLDALGLDSLMTMELFMGLGRGLELALAADWFTPGPTLAEIAQVLARRLEASLAGGAP